MTLRSKLFWAIDAAKGRPIKRHLTDVKHLMSLSFSDNQRINVRRLKQLLDHAKRTVPFFANFASCNDLSEFPVIDKLLIRNRLTDFISGKYAPSRLKRVVTSGSTGTPFQVYHDQQKRLRNTADTLFFASQSGFELGQRLYYFKIWNSLNHKSKLMQILQNIVPVDVTSLSDDNLAALVSQLERDKSRKSFLGYASAFDALSSFCHRRSINQVDSKVSSIIAMSEGFDPGTKDRVQTLFNCHAVSRYSNVENGILAQQPCNGSSEFDTNFASYWIEILETESDVTVGDKQIGRIVVTDLFNFGMPMIRYDTGDLGAMSTCQATGKPILTRIEGRRMDQVYDTRNRLVSSFTITNQMWKYPEIVQYQFIQRSKKDYQFILNVSNARFNRESELVNEFKQYFGNDANILVDYTQEIPLLASGKRKKVVNKCQ